MCLSWSWDPCDPGKHWALGPLAAVRKGEIECIGEGNSCSCYIASGSQEKDCRDDLAVLQQLPHGGACVQENISVGTSCLSDAFWEHTTPSSESPAGQEGGGAAGHAVSQTPALGHAVLGRKKLPHRLHLDCVKGPQSKSSLWFRWFAQPRATQELAVCSEGLSTPEIFP